MFSAFGPIGDSDVLSLTSSSQRFALGTTATVNPAIRLIALNPSHLAWYIKFGDNSVTVSTTDGMRAVPASKEAPLILPVPSGATHVAILAEGGQDGDALISFGGFRDGEFSPLGASSTIAVTQTDQRVALPTLGTGDPCIRLVSANSSISALWVKLGDNTVVGDVETSMRIQPGSVEDPAIIPVTNSQTHLSIFSDGVGGDVVLTGGDIRSGSPTRSTDVLFSTGPRILARDSGAGAGQERTISQVLDYVGSTAQGDILYRGASSWARLAAGSGNGLFLETQGAAANPQWRGGPPRLISSGSLSNVATLDFTIPTNCETFEFELLNWRPATDGASIWARFSQSGSFLSGASDYAWANYIMGSAAAGADDSADSELDISSTFDNAAASLGYAIYRVFRPSASSFQKGIVGYGKTINSAGAERVFLAGGRLIANLNAIDGIRFLFSSGNIAEGYYTARAYGG